MNNALVLLEIVPDNILERNLCGNHYIYGIEYFPTTLNREREKIAIPYTF